MFSFRLSSPLGARSDDELITLQEARAFFKGQNRSIEEDLKSFNAKAAGIAENKYRILESNVFKVTSVHHTAMVNNINLIADIFESLLCALRVLCGEISSRRTD